MNTILIIEDNLDHIKNYISLLKKDYNLLLTQFFDEAKGIIDSHSKEIDLIITDWELGDRFGDGINIIKHVTKNSNLQIKQIPVLMSTAYTSSDKLSEAFQAGAWDYISKPLNKKELNARIESTLAKNKIQKKVKVLLMASNPKGGDFLRMNKEFKRIKDLLGSNRDLFEVEYELEVTRTDLHKKIMDYKPNIVHFTGHGDDNVIYLSNPDDTPDAVENLDEVINNFSKSQNIDCVLINSCNSHEIVKGIDSNYTKAIGTLTDIYDIDALRFSEGFYLYLSQGYSITDSYKNGITFASTKNYITNFDI